MTRESGSSGGADERADGRAVGGLDGRAVLLAAGLADLAVSTVGSGLGVLRGLLRRSDAAEMASDAERDLEARGRLALDRYVSPPPAHLELLARHVLARRAGDGG
ncbi:polyprenyl synthetase [Streptomyces sp. NPDC056944]|uniref:polyprenyl synthetase n=1 Tax=unclassified Streptomyces TaxID=2593676 RepID=UPI00362AE815